MDKINPQYRKMIEQINADGEDYESEEMKPLYKEQSNALNEVHTLIGALFIKYAIDGLLKLNSSQKAQISSNIDNKLKTIGKDLGQSEVNKITDILKKVYADTYYKNAFVMDSGMKINLKFNLLKDEFINAAVNSKLNGELFSDRIWKNKANMIDKLKNSMLDCMKGNTTIDKAAKNIKETFNASAYESHRLVTTELTRVQAQAQTDIAESTGVERQMWSATLDGQTCAECAALDGKTFGIDNDSRPEMPLHPLDRCCWINVPFDGWEPSKRKDNETKDIIDYKDYENWAEDKGIFKNNDTNSGNSDIIKLPDTEIGNSVGAKSKNYDIQLPSGDYVNLAEGTKITNSTVIAGKGRNRQIDMLDVLVADYGGNPEDWQKAKGFGYVNIDGEVLKAELHWYQEPTVGKVNMKIKQQKDGELFIYES